MLRAGLSSAAWITVDDTGARHKAKNGFCTQIGNAHFTWFGHDRLEKPRQLRHTCRFSKLRWPLTNPITSPNQLNSAPTPHSIINGDACFAYFNKIRDILRSCCRRWG